MTVNNVDIEMLQNDLDWLVEWTVENEMKINPGKRKALSLTRARVNEPLNYVLRDQVIAEPSSCKYFGIILHSDLCWAEQVN
jgi:hypothetical protein